VDALLHEFFRPHFHRGRVDDIALLGRSLQAWLVDYNQHRTTATTWPDEPHRRSRSNSADASARLQPELTVKQQCRLGYAMTAS